MVVLPYDMEENVRTTTDPIETNIHTLPKTRKNSNKGSVTDRQSRILKIALKLAKINGFNEDLNVIGEDGIFINESNLAKLLNVTQTKIRKLRGMNELIKLLFQVKIDPELIINEMVKQKLHELNNTTSNSSFNRSNISDSPDSPDPGNDTPNTTIIRIIPNNSATDEENSFSNKRTKIINTEARRKKMNKRRHSTEEIVNKKRKSTSSETNNLEPWQIPFNDEDSQI